MTESQRIERDSIGEVPVSNEALWGAQTQRSLINFNIGTEKVPLEIIYALSKIKRAAAITNNHLKRLDKRKKDLIIKATLEIEEGQHNHQFPLKVWQTGSGTQTNMNVNEVICNIAAKIEGVKLGEYSLLNPNDDVNLSQSTNDTFPAAIQLSSLILTENSLIPEIDKLINCLQEKEYKWKDIVKTGRTHYQDAVPMTLGQEVAAWKEQITFARDQIIIAKKDLLFLPLGGTAIGTGINAPEKFDHEIVNQIQNITKLPFKSAKNKFSIMASHNQLVNFMSKIKLLAVTLNKIVNDIRFLSSGPRTGIGELILPENEPGSSIMPGKVNPTQCEAMSMVCTQIIGLDLAVSIAGSGGHLQMNTYKPLIGLNIINSIKMLSKSSRNFRVKMIEGMQPNTKKIKYNLENSLMLVTALSPIIGYKKASEIAQYAHKKNTSLKQAANDLNIISENDFDSLVNPKLMI
tara:strand:- start:2178 stop:3563 length:1386 start_codon:yes stop_codon:yes gene_type:complete